MHYLARVLDRKAIVNLLRKVAGVEAAPGRPERARVQYLEKVNSMNMKQYEDGIRQEADRIRAQAESLRSPQKYQWAGEMYERCGCFREAADCYRAARELEDN